MKKEKISIRGARVHNLKNIDIDLPRGKLVVLTGLSGSGKSSLAFDTVYAEGQRRYVESLSAYARQFLGQMEKPDVDSIEGLSPAISIDQKTTSRNPRSTVGTTTEIHDYLRLLWSRVGEPFCCGKPVRVQTSESVVEQLSQKDEIILLAPLVEGRKGEHKKIIASVQEGGWSRVYIDGEIYLLNEVPKIEKQKRHTISIVIDRLRGGGQRLRESVETALREGDGKLDALEKGVIERFSLEGVCDSCGRSAPDLEPRLFSFNSPYGACGECTGLGYRQVIDPELLVPDPTLSIEEGALDPFLQNASRIARRLYKEVAEERGVPTDRPWKKLSQRDKKLLLWGDKKKYTLSLRSRFGGQRTYRDISFPGIIPALERKHAGTDSDWKRNRIESMMSLQKCPSCQGARLRPEALDVLVEGKSIHEISSMPVDEALLWAKDLQLSPEKREIARMVVREIKERLQFLHSVGLGYLSLARSAVTLSGGEAQRIRLATQIGSALTGVLYVLDEPSIGLHQRDNEKLLQTLKNLRDLGNTVLVVEHDESTMLAADWLVDMGPGAGEFGGEVVAAGTPRAVCKKTASLTGQYLLGKKKIAVPEKRKVGQEFLEILGAKANNLQNIDVRLPLGVQTCVTGVSGSGKSTLVNDILFPALSNRLQNSRLRAGEHDGLRGIEALDKVIQIDQAPIGRTPRSNPATYTGVWDHVRQLYAGTRESRARGYKPGRFSFNVRGGRCEKCEGDGVLKIEMHFLPDVFVQCSDCAGRRYNQETLEILWNGKSVADVLEMSVDDAIVFFKKIPKIARRLQTLQDVGLGYIRLGQPATELSGGEAQRVKLSSELARKATGKTLYILDEPTTGLHFADVERLLRVLGRLRDGGNTVLLVEHNLDVAASSDWIIDLGPEGGKGGGEVVATGTPEEIAKKQTHTGRVLEEHLRDRV